MKVGDFVTIRPIVSDRKLSGRSGRILLVFGDKPPFHFLVKLTAGLDGQFDRKDQVLVRGDELRVKGC